MVSFNFLAFRRFIISPILRCRSSSFWIPMKSRGRSKYAWLWSSWRPNGRWLPLWGAPVTEKMTETIFSESEKTVLWWMFIQWVLENSFQIPGSKMVQWPASDRKIIVPQDLIGQSGRVWERVWERPANRVWERLQRELLWVRWTGKINLYLRRTTPLHAGKLLWICQCLMMWSHDQY